MPMDIPFERFIEPATEVLGLDRCITCRDSDIRCFITNNRLEEKCYHCSIDNVRCAFTRKVDFTGLRTDFTFLELSPTASRILISKRSTHIHSPSACDARAIADDLPTRVDESVTKTVPSKQTSIHCPLLRPTTEPLDAQVASPVSLSTAPPLIPARPKAIPETTTPHHKTSEASRARQQQATLPAIHSLPQRTHEPYNDGGSNKKKRSRFSRSAARRKRRRAVEIDWDADYIDDPTTSASSSSEEEERYVRHHHLLYPFPLHVEYLLGLC